MSDKPDFEKLFYQLIASLTLCDDINEVADDVSMALLLAKSNIKDKDWSSLSGLGRLMGKRGGTTLYGASVSSFYDD